MVSASAESGRPGHLNPGQQHMVHKLREDVSVVATDLAAQGRGLLCARAS